MYKVMYALLCWAFIGVLVHSCGYKEESDPNDHRAAPISCSIIDRVLYCTDGTSYVLPVQPVDGKNGGSCTINDQIISCPDGTKYTFPIPAIGAQGPMGTSGEPGSSCSVVGNQIQCTDGTFYTIPSAKDGINGVNGTNGINGTNGKDGKDAIVSIIDPCGVNSGGVDELLFVLSTGQIVAWYQNVGLVALKDGTYRTTDSQSCVFKIISGAYHE